MATLRACDVCGGVDDQGRHVTAAGPNFPGAVPPASVLKAALANGATDEMVDALLDPETVIRHFSCCAAQGCEFCAATTATTPAP